MQITLECMNSCLEYRVVCVDLWVDEVIFMSVITFGLISCKTWTSNREASPNRWWIIHFTQLSSADEHCKEIPELLTLKVKSAMLTGPHFIEIYEGLLFCHDRCCYSCHVFKCFAIFIVGSFAHGFTYSGHPVPCAVALEALKIYQWELKILANQWFKPILEKIIPIVEMPS